MKINPIMAFNLVFNKNKQNKSENFFQNPIANNVSFSGINCLTEDFKIKKMSDIHCPACGLPMLTQNEYYQAASDISKLKGEKLAKELDKYEPYYREIEAQVAEILKKDAIEHPEMDLGELVRLEKDVSDSELASEQIKVLNSIKPISKLVNSYTSQKDVKDLIEKNIEIIKKHDEQRYFKRKQFLQEFNELLDTFEIQNSKKKKFNQLRAKADELPTSGSCVGAFFAKYSRRSNKNIAGRLLHGAISTTEHIEPFSLGGKDNTANYLSQCYHCNEERGNTPFGVWIATKENMPIHLQNYLNVVNAAIADKKYQNYSDYTDDIIDTVEKQTGGKIKLIDPKEIKIIEENKAKEEIEKNPDLLSPDEKIAVLNEKIQDVSKEIEALFKITSDIKNSEEFKNYTKYVEITSAINLAEKNEKTNRKAFCSLKRRYEKSVKENQPKKIQEENKTELVASEIELNNAKETHKKELARFLELKKRFETPEALSARIKDLQFKLNSAVNLDLKLQNTLGEYSTINNLKERLAKINNKIEESAAKIAELSLKFDEEDPKSVQIIKDYRTNEKKLEIVENAPVGIFARIFTPTDDIEQGFMLELSKNALLNNKAELLKTPEAKREALLNENKELLDTKDEILLDIKAINEKLSKVSDINSKMNEILGLKTIDDLENELNSAKQKAKNYKDFENLPEFFEKIKNLKAVVKEYTDEIQKIENEKNAPTKEEQELLQKEKEVQNIKAQIRTIKGKIERANQSAKKLSDDELEIAKKELALLSSRVSKAKYLEKNIDELEDEFSKTLLEREKIDWEDKAKIKQNEYKEKTLKEKIEDLYSKQEEILMGETVLALSEKIEEYQTKIAQNSAYNDVQELSEKLEMLKNSLENLN